MSCNPDIETIRHTWDILRPLILAQINKPSPALAKALSDEVYKFETILKGDIQNLVILFRESVYMEHKAHDRTKSELERLRLDHDRLRANLERLTLPKSPDLNARMPSPVEPEEGEWGGESDF